MSETWAWDSTLFAGAAGHYSRGRLPYAPRLAEALREALRLDGAGRLLDVGCGPGTVTLPFAPYFAEAVGLDPDPEMLAEAGRLAAEAGLSNCTWVCLRAEEIPARLGRFRAITFAQSFHWMDRERVAATVRRMLDPGGALVHVDKRDQGGGDPPPGSPYPAVPGPAIEAIIRSYLGPGRRAGQGVRNDSPSGEDAIFRAAGFAGPEVVTVPDGRLLERSIEETVHFVLSMSWAAPHLFGDRLPAFTADVRALLEKESRDGRFMVLLPGNLLKIWRPVSGP
jgi:SAM-dependent methyltransferase